MQNLHNVAMLPKLVKDGKWSRLPLGLLKINVDIAWDEGKMGIGVIVRDSNGFVVGGSFCFKVQVASIDWVEVAVISHSLH